MQRFVRTCECSTLRTSPTNWQRSCEHVTQLTITVSCNVWFSISVVMQCGIRQFGRCGSDCIYSNPNKIKQCIKTVETRTKQVKCNCLTYICSSLTPKMCPSPFEHISKLDGLNQSNDKQNHLAFSSVCVYITRYVTVVSLHVTLWSRNSNGTKCWCKHENSMPKKNDGNAFSYAFVCLFTRNCHP